MKSKKMLRAGLVMAVVFVIGAGIIPASASELTIKNMTLETVSVGLYTRSDYSWDKYSMGFGSCQPLAPNASYTFNMPWDSRHMCASYIIGYNADYTKTIVTMGCNGTEGDMSSRCCENLYFQVIKKTDGLHFQKN